MKKILFLGFLILVACGENTTKALKEVNITYSRGPGFVPVIINHEKHFFSNDFALQNIKVNYFNFTSGMQQMNAIAAQSIDFSSVLSGAAAIIGAANGVDFKILGIVARAPKSFKIMTMNTNIHSLDDLKGKKIGAVKGTTLHQLLLATLKQQNLTIDDVEFISMKSAEALTSMIDGEIDAAVLVGATALAAEEQGATTLSTGEGLIDGAVVMGVRGDFLKKYPKAVDTFLKAHEESVQFISKNPEEANEIVAKEMKLPLKAIQQLNALYDFNPKITEEDIVNLNNTQNFLFEAGLIQKKIDINKIIVKK